MISMMIGLDLVFFLKASYKYFSTFWSPATTVREMMVVVVVVVVVVVKELCRRSMPRAE